LKLVNCRGLESALEAVRVSVEATLMASIDILRDLFKPLTASKTSQGLCAAEAIF
jgi:hypothetical protein